MSNENPTPPAAPEPHQPPPAQHPAPQHPPAYQPPAYQQVQYAPRPVRPPLTKRAKSGAAWAGIVGFNVLTVGFFLFFVPLAMLAMGSFIQWIVSTAAAGTSDAESLEFFDTFDPSAWVVPLLIVSAVGIVIWFVGLVISKAILRSSGAVKPWGITWAAAGIAIVAYWIVWTILGLVSSIISSLVGILTESLGNQATAALVSGILSVVFAIVINSVIGWLVWLWMAHAMRPTQQQLVTQE